LRGLTSCVHVARSPLSWNSNCSSCIPSAHSICIDTMVVKSDGPIGVILSEVLYLGRQCLEDAAEAEQSNITSIFGIAASQMSPCYCATTLSDGFGTELCAMRWTFENTPEIHVHVPSSRGVNGGDESLRPPRFRARLPSAAKVGQGLTR
jgi:hypothetical protein